MRAMRVQQFGEPDVMRMETLDDPKPDAGQVLVRVKAVGVNPLDTYIRSGNYGRLPTLPYTPGSDAAGIVEAVGSGVSKFRAGDRVYIGGTAVWRAAGAYADLALCNANQVHPLPAQISFSQGAALNVPYVTAYRALFDRARAQAGETVLVHGGSGGAGIATVQFARAYGLVVIATAGTPSGLELVRSEGAHHALDHKAAGYLDELKTLTGGRGVDVIVEMLVNVNLDHDLGVLALHGRVVMVGNRGRIEIDPRQGMSRDAAVLGMTLFNLTEEDMARAHAAIVAGLETGSLRPIVREEMPLSEAARAHRTVLEPGAHGKIVLIP